MSIPTISPPLSFCCSVLLKGTFAELILSNQSSADKAHGSKCLKSENQVMRYADRETDTHGPIRYCTYRIQLSQWHCYHPVFHLLQEFTHDRHGCFLAVLMRFNQQHEYRCTHNHTRKHKHTGTLPLSLPSLFSPGPTVCPC